MSLISIIASLLLVVIIIVAVSISIKKKTILPVVISILIIFFIYLGLSFPFCQTKSDFFVEDDPLLSRVLSKQQTVGNFIWSAPRWKVEGKKVTSCNAVYEVLLLGTFGR